MHYEQVFAIDSDHAIQLLTTCLIEQGCHLERSFDLRSALTQPADFLCPHHGATACNCQFSILLVHDQHCASSPTVITVHECEGFTRLKFDTASAELGVRLTTALTEVARHVMSEA